MARAVLFDAVVSPVSSRATGDPNAASGANTTEVVTASSAAGVAGLNIAIGAESGGWPFCFPSNELLIGYDVKCAGCGNGTSGSTSGGVSTYAAHDGTPITVTTDSEAIVDGTTEAITINTAKSQTMQKSTYNAYWPNFHNTMSHLVLLRIKVGTASPSPSVTPTPTPKPGWYYDPEAEARKQAASPALPELTMVIILVRGLGAGVF